ncbi:MAG TPA: hypothetical protein VK670_17780 [Silvibacterium sp.]|nr:hypothetical protein [Silvibacterium sp.]
MRLTQWDYVLWISGVAGYLILAAVLLIKKRYRTFPWFSALLATEILQSLVLSTVCSPRYPLRYFYAYWAGEVLNAVLLAAVIFEVARQFSREAGTDEPSLLRDLRIIAWTLPALTSMAILFFRFLPDLHHELANLAFKIDTVCAIMMLGLVGTVSLSMYFYGVRFRVHAAAIGYGLLLYAVGRVLVFVAALNTADASLWSAFERWLKPLYILTLFLWSGIFWLEEPKRKFSREVEWILAQGKMSSAEKRPVHM